MTAALSRRALLSSLAATEYPDIRSVPQDLFTPPAGDGPPAPGRRVSQSIPEQEGSSVHHTLYLPRDWEPGRRYPVIFEYAGNGGYRNRYGDVSEGTVEGSNMGYGISGGEGFLWVCLPFVDSAGRSNVSLWWGDTAATAAYARGAAQFVCEQYGGNRQALILAGFSRGSIACNYIGLRDHRIAALWRAFICYSHYDGVRPWPHADSDRASALDRLKRLRNRPQFIIHENSVEPTREYLVSTGVQAPFTFRTLEFRNHNDAWTLRDVPERRQLRAWLREVLR
jgi:hypothetical protein